jgi:hypothetical protein
MQQHLLRFLSVSLCCLGSYLSDAQAVAPPFVKYSQNYGDNNYTVGGTILETRGQRLSCRRADYLHLHPRCRGHLFPTVYYKTDRVGKPIWSTQIMGEGNNHLAAVAETKDAYIVAGNIDSAAGDFKNFPKGNCGFLAWLDKRAGTVKTIKPFQQNGMTVIQSVISIDDDNLLVFATKGGADTGQTGYVWYFKLDKNGNTIWEQSLDYNLYAYWLSPCTIAAKKDNGFLLTFQASYQNASYGPNTLLKGYKGSADAWIVNMDKNGNILWSKCYGGSNSDVIVGIKDQYVPDGKGGTTSNGFLCTGVTNSTDGDVTGQTFGGLDFWAMHIDDTGNVLWSKCYGGSNDDFECSTAFTNDGGAVLYGYTDSKDGDCSINPKGAMELMLTRIDRNGEKKWVGMYSTGDGPGMHGSVTTTADSNFAFAMSGFSCFVKGSCNPNALAANIVFGKLGYDSGDEPTVIRLGENIIDIYPNPVTDKLTISFEYPNADEMEILLCDVAGQIVYTTTTSTPGRHYKIDLGGIANGMYFLKLKTKKEQLIKKIVVHPRAQLITNK